MIVLALDPGETTGAALFTPSNFPLGKIDTAQIVGDERTLYNTIRAINPQKIVYEAFTFRQGAVGVNYAPAERIGVIKLYCQLTHTECSSMTSSQGKAFWTDAKIKALNLWVPGQRHGMDALRILLTKLMYEDEFRIWALAVLRESTDNSR